MSAGPPPPPARSFTVSPPQLTLLVVCVVAVYFTVGFFGKSAESYRLSQRAADVRRQIGVLEQQNAALRDRVAYLSTDAFVETTARDKLNLVRPGDRSLVAIDAEPLVVGVAAPPAEPDRYRVFPQLGHLDDWLTLFFAQ